MKTEKGVIIIAWYKPRREPRYLVLKRKKNWEGWELPKGHLENNDERETVKIELEEEAGIEENKIKSIENLGENVEWEFEDEGEEIHRDYQAYMVEVEADSKIDTSNNPHDEHETGYFFNLDDCKGLLTYEDHIEILEKAHELVTER